MDKKYEALKLENQLCFPLYAGAKEIVRQYQPMLKKLDLTYTQYIAMLVMWEKKSLSVKALGELLYLDSGTLTPVLKKLEQKHYIVRSKDPKDERSLVLSLTEIGAQLQEDALEVVAYMGNCLPFTQEEIQMLQRQIYKMLGSMRQ